MIFQTPAWEDERVDSWEFEAELWPWKDATDAWIFVTAPPDVTEEIREAAVVTGPLAASGR